MNKNPHLITYDDLIKNASDRLDWMERSYPGRVKKGDMLEVWATRQILIQKRLIKLLTKHRRNPEKDLFEVHEGIKVKEEKQ